MNCRKLLTKPLIGFPIYQRALSTAVLFGMIIIFLAGTAYAQPELENQYNVKLRSRIFTPQPGIKPMLRDSLMIQLRRGERRHVYLQLNKHLNAGERAELKAQGVELLSYIGAYTWHAAVSGRQALNFAIPDSVSRTPILGTMRWVGEIRPEDRVNPKILIDGVAPHARGAVDTVYLVVKFQSDVNLDNGASLVNRIGGRVMGKIEILNTLQVAIPERIINQLIRLDIVQWVDQLPPKGEDDNDELRPAINANVLQVAPYNLDGTNVTIGQWETRNSDDTHDDFGTRVTIGDPPASTSSHATHVCGILLGDGTRSSPEGGTANQWRGVATNANCISFRRREVGGALDVAATNAQYTTALASPFDIAISTNSWGTGHYHDGDTYDVGCEFYDQVVCGALGRPIPIVTSAGNQGPENSGTNWTTVRIPNSAKNTIEVGSIFSDRDEISWSSSTGPTDDGRLKPDVVAPGDQADDDPINPWSSGDKIRSCIPTDTYGEKSGTSMSTPAVSGVIALMLHSV